MRKELSDMLFERYPEIFDEYTQPGAEEKRFKFWCKDGWFDLIDTLCAQLQNWTNRHNAPQFVVFDVKEKFGALRFVGHHASAEQKGAVFMAYALSTRLCEECGAPVQLVVDGGCWMTRCAQHAPEGAMLAEEFQQRLEDHRQAQHTAKTPAANGMAEWSQRVMKNMDRMAVDEEYRKSIAKDLS